MRKLRNFIVNSLKTASTIWQFSFCEVPFQLIEKEISIFIRQDRLRLMTQIFMCRMLIEIESRSVNQIH